MSVREFGRRATEGVILLIEASPPTPTHEVFALSLGVPWANSEYDVDIASEARLAIHNCRDTTGYE